MFVMIWEKMLTMSHSMFQKLWQKDERRCYSYNPEMNEPSNQWKTLISLQSFTTIMHLPAHIAMRLKQLLIKKQDDCLPIYYLLIWPSSIGLFSVPSHEIQKGNVLNKGLCPKENTLKEAIVVICIKHSKIYFLNWLFILRSLYLTVSDIWKPNSLIKLFFLQN